MFEKAARLKLRFQYKGVLDVEDLWDLPLSALKQIYKDTKAQLKDADGDDFLLSLENETNEKDKLAQLRFDIVKHIMTVKVEEAKNKKDDAERKAYRQKLLAIKAQKQEKALENLSEEELDKLIKEA